MKNRDKEQKRQDKYKNSSQGIQNDPTPEENELYGNKSHKNS
ncbi:hypothetical protein [Bacillus alveayuensis]|nr:hypothetical protein [Bacillus alveayuensis]